MSAINRMKEARSFGRIGRLLSFLAILCVAVFPHSVHSYSLHDNTHGQHEHEVSLLQEELPSGAGSKTEVSERDHSESEHDEDDETEAHEDCSYLCDFALSESKDYMPLCAVNSFRAWRGARLPKYVLSSDPPPPRVQS